MDDTRETGPRPTSTPTSDVSRKTGRGPLLAMIAVVIAFVVGFGWQFYEASTVRTELSTTQQELLVQSLRAELGQAALAASVGDYEGARRQMSGFFSRISEVSAGLPQPVADVADEFMAMRDEVITGLSRSNPDYAAVLYGMAERLAEAAEDANGREAPAGAQPGENIGTQNPTGGSDR